MYILTNGVNYVMENPMQKGRYIATTYPVQASEFTYKQARSLMQNKKKNLSWIRSYYMINKDNKKICDISPNYKGNANVYIGDNDVNFKENIVDDISNEANRILELFAWNKQQLNNYREELTIGLSKYDSIESDISHALQKYKEDNCGKKLPAHKMAKLGYILDDIRDKHKRIKECLRYVQVMENAINNCYTVEKIKSEINDAKNKEYKGRTEYYQMILDLLN